MKKIFVKEVIVGYEIGREIEVHNHITDPESWFVTIRPLDIFGKTLCKKGCTEDEIARYVYLVLNKKNKVIIDLMEETFPFT